MFYHLSFSTVFVLPQLSFELWCEEERKKLSQRKKDWKNEKVLRSSLANRLQSEVKKWARNRKSMEKGRANWILSTSQISSTHFQLMGIEFKFVPSWNHAVWNLIDEIDCSALHNFWNMQPSTELKVCLNAWMANYNDGTISMFIWFLFDIMDSCYSSASCLVCANQK